MNLLQYDAVSKTVTLNYMWLPTWLGMNAAFKRDLERDFQQRAVGRAVDDLGVLEEEVLDYIAAQHPALKGLREYLAAVHLVDSGGQTLG